MTTQFPHLKPIDHHSNLVMSQAGVGSIQTYEADYLENQQLTQVEAFFKEHLGLDTNTLKEFFKEDQERVKKYSGFKYSWGVDTSELTTEETSRANPAALAYAKSRAKVLSDLNHAFKSSPTLNHLNNFFTIAEKAHKAAGATADTESPHVLEVQAAAKKAVRDKPTLAAILTKDPRAYLLNPIIRDLTQKELERREELFTKIATQIPQHSARKDINPVSTRLADFGVGNAMAYGTLLSLIGGVTRFTTRKILGINDPSSLVIAHKLSQKGLLGRLINGCPWLLTRAKESFGAEAVTRTINELGSIKSKATVTLADGTKIVVNSADEAIKKFLKSAIAKNGSKGLWTTIGKQLLRKHWIGLAVAAVGSSLYIAAQDNPDWIKPVKKGADAVWKAARDYAIPDFGIFLGNPWLDHGGVTE